MGNGKWSTQRLYDFGFSRRFVLVIEILTSVLTIQSSISQFEFLFEQLSTIKLFQCFHIQLVAVPFFQTTSFETEVQEREPWDF
jgi:hypothetical protein